MSYISTSDITDKIADGFEVQQYILESDDAVEDLAEKLGVRSTSDIETSPVHHKVRRYAIAYCLMRLCQDKVGAASTDVPEANKYLIGYEMYKKEVSSLTKEINYQMFTGEVNAVRDRVSSVDLSRG